MDDLLIRSDSVLQFHCPRCGHPEQDEFETIDTSVPTDWRCGNCHCMFSTLLAECEHCASETVSVALASNEQRTAAEMVCQCCGKPCLHDEELDQEDLST